MRVVTKLLNRKENIMLSRFGQFTGSRVVKALKWLALVFLPAFEIFYKSIYVEMSWPGWVMIVLPAFNIFLAAIIFTDDTSIKEEIEENDAGADQ